MNERKKYKQSALVAQFFYMPQYKHTCEPYHMQLYNCNMMY